MIKMDSGYFAAQDLIIAAAQILYRLLISYCSKMYSLRLFRAD
jgi:hypothetical protein